MLLGEKLQSAEGRFLVFDKPEGDAFAHEYLMLSENEIKGMLPFGIQSRNTKQSYVYNISGLQSLTELFSQREIVHKELLLIFKGLSAALDGLSEYLLEGSGLMLDPEYIFEDLNRELFFIFIPGAGNDLAVSMRELALFLIKRTDHRDEEAVRDAYDFYKRVYAGDYSTKRYFERDPLFIQNDAIIFNETLPVKSLPEAHSKQDKSGFEYNFGKEDTVVAEGVVGDFDEEEETLERGAFGDYEKAEEVVSGGTLENYDEAEETECERTDFASERTVYALCAAGLILLAAFIGYAGVFSPESLGRIFHNSRAVAFSGITGAILVLIPVMYSKERLLNQRFPNKYAGSGSGRAKKGRRAYSSGPGPQLYYLSTDREGSERSLLFMEFPVLIGKASDCGGIIDSRAVSRHHARIDKRKEGCFITDLGSTNGTWLRGKKLERHCPELLNSGDEIMFADRRYFYTIK